MSTKKHQEVLYKTLTTKILSLHKGNRSVSAVVPGASISIETSLDPFLTKADFLTGCVVSLVGKLPEIKYKIRLKTKLFPEVFGLGEGKKVEPFRTKEFLMLSIGTTITVGTVENVRHLRFLDNQLPSKSGDEIELNLNIPVVVLSGDNAGIARNIDGHWRLIGWGEVL